MKIVRYLVLLLCIAAAIHAKSKEFTILGKQKIQAEVKRGVPLPAEKGGVRIESAAFRIGDAGLQFGFIIRARRPLSKILVEEVSGRSPVVMVEDPAPAFKGDRWLGMAKPQPLTPATLPWLFEHGDTTKVFRFSVLFADTSEPLVLFQPAIYSAKLKQITRDSRKAKKS